MENDPEALGSQLITSLDERMSQQEDAAAAISSYKIANWVISQLEGVKSRSLNLAEHDLRLNQKDSVRTPAGSAGWTEPKARILNTQKWQEAMARDPGLAEAQRNFEVAQAVLQRLQEPFMELPESVFFIR